MVSKNSDVDLEPRSSFNIFFKNNPSCRKVKRNSWVPCIEDSINEFKYNVSQNQLHGSKKMWSVPECLEKQVVLRSPWLPYWAKYL